MGDLTEGSIQQEEQATLPTQKVDRTVIQRLIEKLKKPETLEQVTGGTPAPIEELTEQGQSPIHPIDDFLQEKTEPVEQVKEEE